MNQFFSFKRWLLLMTRHWLEHRKLYIYGTLSLIGAMVITAGLWFWTNFGYHEVEFYWIFLIGLYITGAIFASMSFKMVHQKEQGIYYLSLPASRFEKLLTLVIYNIILFSIVYFLCFKLTHFITMSIVESKVATGNHRYYFYSAESNGAYKRGVLNIFTYCFFSVQTMFFLGSIYFKRFHFLLTLIVLVLLLLVLGGKYYGNFPFIPKGYQWIPPEGVVSYEGGIRRLYRLSPILQSIFKWILLLGWVPAFLLVAWFRLGEKEI